jgi:hypothetical protein
VDDGCVICGRRGAGVRDWGIVMPGGTVAGPMKLCSPHSKPLRQLTTKSIRERRVVGLQGLDALADPDA